MHPALHQVSDTQHNNNTTKKAQGNFLTTENSLLRVSRTPQRRRVVRCEKPCALGPRPPIRPVKSLAGPDGGRRRVKDVSRKSLESWSWPPGSLVERVLHAPWLTCACRGGTGTILIRHGRLLGGRGSSLRTAHCDTRHETRSLGSPLNFFFFSLLWPVPLCRTQPVTHYILAAARY